MICPACQDADAYVGLHAVDCLNPECIHFNESYLEEKLQETEQSFKGLIRGLGIEDELSSILNKQFCEAVDRDFVEILDEMWLGTFPSLGIPMSAQDDNGDTECDS